MSFAMILLVILKWISKNQAHLLKEPRAHRCSILTEQPEKERGPIICGVFTCTLSFLVRDFQSMVAVVLAGGD